MKKNKLLLPVLGIGSILAGLTSLTSCVFVQPQIQEPEMKLYGGDTQLLCDLPSQYDIAETYFYSGKAWHVSVDGDAIDLSRVTFTYEIIQGPKNLNTLAQFEIWYDSTFRWTPFYLSRGVYKFRIIASYRDKKSANTLKAVSDEITLTVLGHGQQGGVIPGEFKVTNTAHTINHQSIRSYKFDYLRMTNMQCNPYELDIEAKEIVEEGQEPVLNIYDVYCERVSSGYSYYSLYIDLYLEDGYIPVGDHKISLTISDSETGYKFFTNYEITISTGFEEDSWDNVAHYANQGIAALQEHYGVESFVGLTRVVNILGEPHYVKVIGQEHDIDANGKKLPLTFEFMTPIEIGIDALDDQYKDSPFTTLWDFDGSNGNYWQSDINQALNGDTYDYWFQLDAKGHHDKSTETQSVSQLLQPSVARAIKPVQKTVTTFDQNLQEYVSTTKTTYLFLPTIASLFSRKAILEDEVYIVSDAQRRLTLAEDTQYEYYTRDSLNTLEGSTLLNKYNNYNAPQPTIYWLASPYLESTTKEGNYSWVITYTNSIDVGYYSYPTPYLTTEFMTIAVAPRFCI
ncbi:MAG: hypothetical protein ACOQNY_00250 [Mycoplasmoidaceae bacterium]